jgi:hypothetical protein
MPRKAHVHEWKEPLDEAVERAHHAQKGTVLPPWTRQLSLTTAVIAVLTAIGSLGAEYLSQRALIHKNDMVYTQAKASDQWAFYQAKSLKGMLSAGFADTLAQSDPARAQRYRQEAARYKEEQVGIKDEADKIQSSIQSYNDRAALCMGYHHDFSLAVTLFQVAIALSAIAVLIGRRLLWKVGLVISMGALIFLLKGLAYFL